MIQIENRRKSVLVRGPVLTQSGYGVHARQIAKWLLEKPNLDVEFQALPWGETPWLINRDFHQGLIGKIMEKTVDPMHRKYDASVQIQLPNEWDTKFAPVNIGVTAGIETDICNPEWIKSCNNMSLVIVPSKHAEQSLTNSGLVTKQIHVVPESFPECYTQTSEKNSIDELDFSTSFNFLLVGQITGNNPENDRKNIFYTIKWLCETFEKDKDVGIIIKTNAGRNTTADRKVVTQIFEKLLSEVRKGPYPKLHLLHGDMSDEEIHSLYTHPKVKGFISLTRGEGYGLPLLEAAASGLPVIATGWSGHIDFLSHGKFIDIPYKLDVVHQSRIDNKIFMQGCKWAHPIEEEFKKKILKFRTSSSIPSEWAKSLQQTIIEKYSFESIKKMYNQITGDLI